MICKLFILSTLLHKMQSSPYADPVFIRCERKSCPARLLFRDVALLRNVQTVQELCPPVSIYPLSKREPDSYLPDILVSYSADLLDVGGGL
jgi:hypothetical protein